MTLTYIVSGFVVGILVGLTGVGGGSLMTPLLTLLFGVSPSVAVGTDLAFASLTKSAGVLTHKLRGTVNWKIVRLLCIGALPAALLATLALKHFGAVNDEIGLIIRHTIAASVLLTVVALIFKRRMLNWLSRHPEKQLQGHALSAATVACGILLGALVTISSIGAGAIGATLIVLLYPKLSSAEIAGTDIAYAVPLTAIAAIGHWWLGSIAAKAVPERVLRFVLASTLTLVAAKLIF